MAPLPSGDSTPVRSALRFGVPRALGLAVLCCAVGTVSLRMFGVRGPGQTTPQFDRWPFLDMWIRWDAGWYQGIATDGYYFSPVQQSSVAYFPLYPMLMRAFTWLGVSPFLAGIAISLVCGGVAASLFYAWAAERLGPATAALGTWLLLLWPFAFFLYGAVYSDGLFLALTVGAFLFLERGQLTGAALLGALATATRPIAPAVVLGLCVRHYELRRATGKPLRLRDGLPALSALGAAAYLCFLWFRFGDPLAFLHTQAGWGQLTGWQSFLKLEFFRRSGPPSSFLLPLFHAVLCLGFLALLVPMRRVLGWGYVVYGATALLMPLLSSRDFIGLGRYSIAAFPCFLMLARLLERRPRWLRLHLAASALLLGVMCSKFAVGRYIS